MTTVVLLGRVSRGERTQDSESQLQALRAAALRHGWAIARELSLTCSAWDESASAKVWTSAIEAIHETGADTLAVWAVDRLARGGIEDVFRKVRELEHLGVQLWSAQEPFLSSTDRQTRELMLALADWVAKWESQRKSERLKAKAALKRTRAENGGGRARWGRGIMPTVEDACKVRDLRAEGKSLRAVAAEVGLSLGTVQALARGTHGQARVAAGTSL
ncbi:MAG: recombinase family protein [Thermoplasmatota archaeon]